MNTDLHTEQMRNPLPEAAREAAHRVAETAKETARVAAATARDATGALEDASGDFTDAARDAAKRATAAAKEVYHSVAVKAEDTMETSREFVRRNPVPVVLGAIAFGAALGYMLMMARRTPTFGERYADEPLVAVRDAIRGALAPVTQRVHRGYDSACEGAGKAMDRVHRFGAERNGNSISHQLGRIGNNLKFW